MTASVTTARRTRVRPGFAAEYARVHARIPDAVADALRRSGVLRWQIFADHDTLFHVIETREGYHRMVETIVALGPIDAEWDALIATILDSEPGADVLLSRVWELDADGQLGGSAPR